MNINKLLEEHANVTLEIKTPWYIAHDHVEGGYKMRHKDTNEDIPSDWEGNLHTKLLNAVIMEDDNWKPYTPLQRSSTIPLTKIMDILDEFWTELETLMPFEEKNLEIAKQIEIAKQKIKKVLEVEENKNDIT